ncbi:hypothetical protein C8R43DRAFT_955220 [Mycena crocata]|nr:hypothetical protein C8R43DRAFT_955220 [Mycena crocata]
MGRRKYPEAQMEIKYAEVGAMGMGGMGGGRGVGGGETDPPCVPPHAAAAAYEHQAQFMREQMMMQQMAGGMPIGVSYHPTPSVLHPPPPPLATKRLVHSIFFCHLDLSVSSWIRDSVPSVILTRTCLYPYMDSPLALHSSVPRFLLHYLYPSRRSRRPPAVVVLEFGLPVTSAINVPDFDLQDPRSLSYSAHGPLLYISIYLSLPPTYLSAAQSFPGVGATAVCFPLPHYHLLARSRASWLYLWWIADLASTISNPPPSFRRTILYVPCNPDAGRPPQRGSVERTRKVTRRQNRVTNGSKTNQVNGYWTVYDESMTQVFVDGQSFISIIWDYTSPTPGKTQYETMCFTLQDSKLIILQCEGIDYKFLFAELEIENGEKSTV